MPEGTRYIPDQPHTETAKQTWHVVQAPTNNAAGILARGFLAVANWGQSELNEAFILPHSSADLVAIPIGSTTVTNEQVVYQLKLKGYGVSLRRVAAHLQVNGNLEFEASEQGKLWIHNIGHVQAVISGTPGAASLVLPPGDMIVTQV